MKAAIEAEKYRSLLWSDLQSDLERAEFIEAGRAWETGIIAPAIARDMADAFRFRHDSREKEQKARIGG